MCHARLEGLLIHHDVGQEGQMSQLGQMVGVEGRPEALMAEALELFPGGLAGAVLQDVVPLLNSTSEVERGEPNLVTLGSALGAEELVTSVELAQQVIFAIIDRKGELVIAWHCRDFWLRRYVRKGRWHVHGGGGRRQGRLHDGGK